jgi:predicted alpha/beta superfamily hydrolase
MNRISNFLILIVFILSFNETAQPQNSISTKKVSDYSLYKTKAEFVYSEIVADSFFILISVPDKYYTSEERYPVLYVLDGDIAYGMAASISRYLQIGDNIPQLIVVGIGYGSISRKAAGNRLRDYRPEQSGGAENFLKFLDDELIPYIDENYRTVPGDRTLNGYSLGGLFGLYTLFTKPESFSNYIIGSPNLSWDDYVIFQYEENSPEKIGDKQLNIFISVGQGESEERYFNPVDSLVTNIQQHNYPGVYMETQVFNGSTHLMGPPESLTHGLISVIGR